MVRTVIKPYLHAQELLKCKTSLFLYISVWLNYPNLKTFCNSLAYRYSTFYCETCERNRYRKETNTDNVD